MIGIKVSGTSSWVANYGIFYLCVSEAAEKRYAEEIRNFLGLSEKVKIEFDGFQSFQNRAFEKEQHGEISLILSFEFENTEVSDSECVKFKFDAKNAELVKMSFNLHIGESHGYLGIDDANTKYLSGDEGKIVFETVSKVLSAKGSEKLKDILHRIDTEKEHETRVYD